MNLSSYGCKARLFIGLLLPLCHRAQLLGSASKQQSYGYN